MAYENVAERKIYFYRIVPLVDEDAAGYWKLDRKALVQCIQDLAGTPEFYFEQDGGERVTCAQVHDKVAPQSVKFYGIRRRDLPSLDSGTGTIGDLELEEEQGLAEAVHVRFFPNAIIGFEAFYHGPRISRIEAFLNARCEEALGAPVTIKQLYRGDMIERALAFEDIRMFHARIVPTAANQKEAAGAGLKGIMDTANSFGASVSAEVRLVAKPDDQTFTNKVKHVIKGWKDEQTDPSGFLEVATVRGKSDETETVVPLNLLSDALVRVVLIERKSERSRALDSDAAFKAIRDAHKQVKSHFPTDAIEA